MRHHLRHSIINLLSVKTNNCFIFVAKCLRVSMKKESSMRWVNISDFVAICPLKQLVCSFTWVTKKLIWSQMVNLILIIHNPLVKQPPFGIFVCSARYVEARASVSPNPLASLQLGNLTSQGHAPPLSLLHPSHASHRCAPMYRVFGCRTQLFQNLILENMISIVDLEGHGWHCNEGTFRERTLKDSSGSTWVFISVFIFSLVCS